MEYSFAGNISSAGHKDKYKSILSRTPLSDKKEFFINGAWTPASVVRAVVEVESFRISVYSLHINGPHADDIVARILPQDDAPYIVVTGDFNNVQGSPVMNLFVDAGFSDALESIGADRGKFTCFFTENGVIEYTGSDASAGKSGGVGGVIDHIIFNRPRKTRVIAGGIIETEKPLSDHKPVWADMEFR